MFDIKIKELQIEIEALPDSDFQQLRQWFADKDWEKWDDQLETDVASGRLDFLLNEALSTSSFPLRSRSGNEYEDE